MERVAAQRVTVPDAVPTSGVAASADVRSAIAASHLARLPERARSELLQDGVELSVPSGAVMHRDGDTAAHLELVLSGVVRVFVRAPDGRTMTVRYCRPGALIGAVSLFAHDFVMPATTQALMPVRMLRLSPGVARRAAATDVEVAQVMLEELSERVVRFIYEIPGSAFSSVRQRAARHLLDLASEHLPVGASKQAQELVAPVSQRELADAVGTAREVVVRVLRELRRAGLVRTDRDGIVIVDPDRLIQETGWNQGS